jgi:hypothetical protein
VTVSHLPDTTAVSLRTLLSSAAQPAAPITGAAAAGAPAGAAVTIEKILAALAAGETSLARGSLNSWVG